MGFRALWEALKIDKVKNVRNNRVALLFLFAFASILYVTEPIKTPAQEFLQGLAAFLTSGKGFPVPSAALIVSLLKQLLLHALALYFVLYSALNYIEYRPIEAGESPDISGGISFQPELPQQLSNFSTGKIALKYYPSILVLATAMMGVQLISIFFLQIPYYVMASMLAMTLFEQIYEERNIFQAMEASAALTKGFKFFIFIQFFVLGSLLSFVENLFLNIFTTSVWAGSLIRAFIFAWLTFSIGRLGGIMYKTNRLMHISLKAMTEGKL